jgi:hypothetical protein
MQVPQSRVALSLMAGLLVLSLLGGTQVHALPTSVTPGQVISESLVLCTPSEGVTEQGTITATGTAASWISVTATQSWSDGPDTVSDCDTIPYSITVPLSASGAYELVWTINTCTFVEPGVTGTCGGLPAVFTVLDFTVTPAPGVPQFPLGLVGLFALAIPALLLVRKRMPSR